MKAQLYNQLVRSIDCLQARLNQLQKETDMTITQMHPRELEVSVYMVDCLDQALARMMSSEDWNAAREIARKVSPEIPFAH